MMTLNDYYKHIYRLSFITRYSNIPRVRNETVAEHSFFVAALVLKLADEYRFNIGDAIQAAICHDITEADVTDITHGIKRDHPDLKNAILNAEILEIRKYPNSVIDGYLRSSNESVEALVVELADVIQVQQYVMSEQDLGNHNLSTIDAETRERIAILRKELKPYERK